MAKEKKCKFCGFEGAVENFKTGHRLCLECHAKYEKDRKQTPECKARRKERYREDIDVSRERNRKYRQENRDKILQDRREWYKENKTKVSDQVKLRTYNVTREEFEAMKNRCDNKCEICMEVFSTPYIDHCHITGCARGLLCQKCNSAIGFLKDDVDLVKSAVRYLEKYSGKFVHMGSFNASL